jgi:ubiquitin C-terminal hydrolase
MKIRTEICFDEVITIPVTVLHPDIRNTPNKYRLSGVICHLGSMNAGHYYAIKKGKLARSNDWYICNDEIIKEANIRPTGN